MKKLALRLLVFAVIIFIVNYLVVFSLPFAWGAPDLETKYEFYRSRADDYDTLFIGSSRFYRHISPSVFDNIVAEIEPVQSFNLGVAAFPAPQPFWLYERILEDDPEHLKYVFIEISPPGDSPPNTNLHTKRFVYWYNFEDTVFLIRSVIRSDTSIPVKLDFLGIHVMTLLEKQFNIGMGLDIVEFWGRDTTNTLNEFYLGRQLDGFHSLDQQLEKFPGISRGISNSQQAFEANPQVLTNRTRQSQQAFNLEESTLEFNEIYFQEIERIIELSTARNIHIIFVLPPRLGNEYLSILPTFYHIAPEHRIELGNPKLYPELYAPEHTFDVGHLNSEGAAVFTELLAHKFISLLFEPEQE